MSEIDQIHDFVREVGDDVEVQWGAAVDEELGEKVRVTIIATGYEVSDIPSIEKKTVDSSINKYYGEAASAPAEKSSAVTLTVNPVEDTELVDEQVSNAQPKTELVDLPESMEEAEEIVIDLEDVAADGQRTLFGGIPDWMRGKKR
jgi:cell division protein FtsZ